MRPSDPRIRANLNRLNEGFESAAQTTQSYLYIASERVSPYISTCLESLSTCLEASCQPCFSARDEHFRSRRHRTGTSGRGRGRDGAGGGRGGIGGFDFYDDWEEEEAEWGNDELERLLNGDDEEGGLDQPRRKVGMSYGSLLGGGGGGGGSGGSGAGGKVLGKRKGGGDEPNVVPQSSMFGFLESLPWKIGGRGSGRFRPGVADLQEGVGRKGGGGDADSEGEGGNKKGRRRSETVESRSTTNSLSSRGDLFPSDDEADAVPLDDEFAMALERRNTAMSDEHGSGRKGGKRPAGSTKSSTKTGSSRETRATRRKSQRGSSASSGKVAGEQGPRKEVQMHSATDLKLEEERARQEEEALVEERREAARKLARERGLADSEQETEVSLSKEVVRQLTLMRY